MVNPMTSRSTPWIGMSKTPACARSELIQLVNPNTNTVMSSKTLLNFEAGALVQWKVSGDVDIVVTPLSGQDAVVNGLFFDAATTPQPSQGTSTATLVKEDSTTDGNWIGNYGSDGYNIIGNTSSYPSYAEVTDPLTNINVLASSTTSPLALQDANNNSLRQASYWTNTVFTVNVSLMDGQAHDVGVYVLGWGTTQRSEKIEVTDSLSGALLDTETLTNVTGQGIYLQWVVTGSVSITFSQLAGGYATVSGLFFDPASSAASLVKQDGATQGNWIGTYGTEGYNVIGNASSYPAFAIVQPSGESTLTWSTSTVDPRALQNANGSGRQASAWTSATSFTIGVNLTGNQPQDIALYAVDWDSMGRSEQIQISTPARRGPRHRDPVEFLGRSLSPMESVRQRGDHGHKSRGTGRRRERALH